MLSIRSKMVLFPELWVVGGVFGNRRAGSLGSFEKGTLKWFSSDRKQTHDVKPFLREHIEIEEPDFTSGAADMQNIQPLQVSLFIVPLWERGEERKGKLLGFVKVNNWSNWATCQLLCSCAFSTLCRGHKSILLLQLLFAKVWCHFNASGYGNCHCYREAERGFKAAVNGTGLALLGS